ncbi:hypothetical protein J6590_016287 [Homalodisca vitripennis]|nr:hypothetical protein J6590_016287 [Homalodisca vitripennis]
MALLPPPRDDWMPTRQQYLHAITCTYILTLVDRQSDPDRERKGRASREGRASRRAKQVTEGAGWKAFNGYQPRVLKRTTGEILSRRKNKSPVLMEKILRKVFSGGL